ncbi:uncharacterized protein PGRI_093960 [Penicillium griseofulvum]|uniref:Uncharacterized protein n=1 Tax=Penicillium patulum TaxID=5078 RepID=A0A135LQZ0_PENPA|nr:uncharacterized protein PGRI_093960 [Penicillium griseofulvum]KXG51384.1 hypothetical protein PGRI_093960 [Penicillium griseofulvum]
MESNTIIEINDTPTPEPVNEPLGGPVTGPVPDTITDGHHAPQSLPDPPSDEERGRLVRSANTSPEPRLENAPLRNTQLQLPASGPVTGPVPDTITDDHHAPQSLPNPRRNVQRGRLVRSANASPEPRLENAPLRNTLSLLPAKSTAPELAIQRSIGPNRKRKAPSSTNVRNNRRRSARKKRTRNAERKYSSQLGHDFVGFVSPTTGLRAFEFATNILQHYVRKSVRKRLVYFSDASIRFLCGAVGIVWPKSFTSTEFEGKGIQYPTSIDSTATLELFGIASALETAINDIDNERFDVVQGLPERKTSHQGILGQTKSHLHHRAKELFVFTDDAQALRRISGSLPYPAKGGIATQLAAISAHSKTLSLLGVHVELHLSPGHSGIPGNEAADAMARETQRQFLLASTTSWATSQTGQSNLPANVPVQASLLGL